MNVTKRHYSPGSDVTAKAAKAIPAGSFVVVSGEMDGRNPVVDVAGADAIPFGVVAADVAKDDYVTIYRAGYVLDAIAAGAITAGAKISTAAGGKAATAGTGPVVAIALTKAAAADKPVTIALL